MNVGDNPLTDCSFFSSVLLSPANETDIADISAAARFATGDSEAFVEGTTLLGEGGEQGYEGGERGQRTDCTVMFNFFEARPHRRLLNTRID